MSSFRALGALSALALAACATTSNGPRADNRPGIDVDELHGMSVQDPYRWLEDVEGDGVKAWMDAQDAAAQKHLGALPGRSELEARLKALYYVDSVSIPVKRGSRYFYQRRPAGAEKSILYVREGDGAEQVLIDPNTLSKDGSVALGVWEPSKDGKRLAYAQKPNNADEATLYVMDVDTKQTSDVDVIEGAKYAEPSWTPDGAGFFYTWLPTDPSIPVADRPGYAEVRFHKVGTPATDDIQIHQRLNDPKTFIDGNLSDDGKWLFIKIWHGWAACELFVRPMPEGGHPSADFDTKGPWTPMAKGAKAMFNVYAHGGTFYIHTTHEAPRWRLFAVDPAKLDRAEWTEIVPEDPQAVLRSFSVVGGKLGLRYMKNAVFELRLVGLDGAGASPVALPALGSASSIVGTPDDDEAFFSFSSYTYAREIYRMSVSSGATEVFQKLDVPIDGSKFEVKQVWYPSKDGTKVSMFIVAKKGLELDGSHPTLLYGYGGFNISITPHFSAWIFPWLEAGGIYAVPNLRGGGEYGEAWHEAGMKTKKQNVFDDYLAAAGYLIEEGYTKSERLGIYGRSNGGLLVGAAMTQRPDLFKAVICGVPLLDMVRYHLFGSGMTWIPEYGSADDPAQFAAIHAYSPYHRVKPGTEYPALLMLSVDTDDRVDPMHARKFVASVQDATAGDAVTLLRIQVNAGHGGADMLRASVAKGVDMLSFLSSELK